MLEIRGTHLGRERTLYKAEKSISTAKGVGIALSAIGKRRCRCRIGSHRVKRRERPATWTGEIGEEMFPGGILVGVQSDCLRMEAWELVFFSHSGRRVDYRWTDIWPLSGGDEGTMRG